MQILCPTVCFDNCFTFCDFVLIFFFHTDKPANLSGFELQGRSSTNQYVTKFQMGFESEADQSSPQIYPTDQNPKVPENLSLITQRVFLTRHAARCHVTQNVVTK